jgi:hypothetical protein
MRGLVAVIAAAVGGAFCQTPQMMSDPVFGMTYDTRKVHFDLAPTLVRIQCRGLPDKTLWLFAYWKERDTELFVLSGRESEVSGIGVVIRPGTCIQSLPDWVLTGDRGYWSGRGGPPPVQFTERVLQGLAADLLNRYARAFGGKNNFIEHVRTDGLPIGELLPTIRREFESFVASPR